MRVYLMYKLLTPAVTIWIHLQCLCYDYLFAVEVREFEYTTFDTKDFMILKFQEKFSMDSSILCAIQCKLYNFTCNHFSFNAEQNICSLGYWLVPANTTVRNEQIYSVGGNFCDTRANVTLQPNGDLTPCDKYACVGHSINVGNKTDSTSLPRYKSCKDITDKTSPRMLIRLLNGLVVMCDTESDGGGWIVLQSRITGALDFYRTWAEYKDGFGDYEKGEFYLGNENIHCLTNVTRYDMRVDVKYNGQNYTFNFTDFNLLDESEFYTFRVSSASPAIYGKHNNSHFSTKDRDYDPFPDGSCALVWTTAGWFCPPSCFYLNQNGGWNKQDNNAMLARTLSNVTGVNFFEMKIRES